MKSTESQQNEMSVADEMTTQTRSAMFGPLFWQLARFGIVGLTAAIIHYSTVVELVQQINMQPLVANIFGFLVAFQISYWGHRYFTFNKANTIHRIAIPRLLLVQIINFSINEALYSIFMAHGLPYNIALIIVLTILPLLTFATSKFWVFR